MSRQQIREQEMRTAPRTGRPRIRRRPIFCWRILQGTPVKISGRLRRRCLASMAQPRVLLSCREQNLERRSKLRATRLETKPILTRATRALIPLLRPRIPDCRCRNSMFLNRYPMQRRCWQVQQSFPARQTLPTIPICRQQRRRSCQPKHRRQSRRALHPANRSSRGTPLMRAISEMV